MNLRDSEVFEVARDVLQTRFPTRRIADPVVRSEEDFDGEPVVQIWTEADAPVNDAAERLAATMDIRDGLLAKGDDRFVYLYFNFPPASEDGAEEDEQP